MKLSIKDGNFNIEGIDKEELILMEWCIETKIEDINERIERLETSGRTDEELFSNTLERFKKDKPYLENMLKELRGYRPNLK